MTQPAAPAFVVTLDFHSHANQSAAAPSVLRGDLSACDQTGSCLWLGCDETTTIERLITRDGVRFAEHQGFDLGRIFPLPAGGSWSRGCTLFIDAQASSSVLPGQWDQG